MSRNQRSKGLNLALIGQGKMGFLVELEAKHRGHRVITNCNSEDTVDTISAYDLDTIDICIDFSHPKAIMDNINFIAKAGKSLVVGTTGWYDKLPEVKKLVQKHKIGFLYAPNFALGMHLFLKLVKEAAKMIDPFDEYDISGYEIHHNQKVDSPSGGAKAMGDIVTKHVKRKKKIVTDLHDGGIAQEEFHLASIRCGHEVGTHSLLLDSAQDSLTITHKSRNRNGFATGAVKGAEWLSGKQGFFTLEDFYG